MTQPRRSPTLRRRRLSAELRRLRANDGRHAQQIDKELGWTVGKLARMERGDWVRPSVRDIADLINIYEVTDDRQREALLDLARQSRERGWWHPYREMLSEDFTTYIGFEAEASSVLMFQPLMVPGLLQIPDYARAVMRGGPAELGDEEIEERLKIRAERQKLLTAETDPLRLVAVLDEAVLHRLIGGPTVMKAQLEHIRAMAKELPKVTLQVVTFEKGAHPGVGGAFTVMEFPEPEDPDAVYSENIAGELLLEDPEEVSRFKLAFQRLGMMSLNPEDSLAMIAASAAKT